MKLANDEVIIRKGVATYLVPFEGIGGKLFLTNQRLLFKPHSFNFQKNDGNFRLEDIVAIEAKHSNLFSRNLTVYLKNKSAEEFIVYRRKIWVSEIERTIKNLKQEAKAYIGCHQKPIDVTPTKGHNFLINLLIRAIIIGIFVGAFIYLLL